MTKDIAKVLTVALLGVVVGFSFSCKEKPKERVQQLAGTHWEGFITFNDARLDTVTWDYRMLFFSSSEGEAGIPEFRGDEGSVRRLIVPFEYTIEPSCIKFKPIPAGSDPWYTYSIRECLSGTWLLKELSANKMTFYRSPESEVVVTLNKVEL